MPTLYIIGGPNGAGKTTASKTILPEMLNCFQFVNADEIAKGLSPFAPESVSLQAGRIMLNRIQELLKEKNDFAIETTLATRSYVSLVKDAVEKNFEVVLLFLWLPSVDLAKKRVAERVFEGGHNIPPDVIERRYNAGLKNLRLFLPLTNRWYIFNNEGIPAVEIARGGFSIQTEISNFVLWEQILK